MEVIPCLGSDYLHAGNLLTYTEFLGYLWRIRVIYPASSTGTSINSALSSRRTECFCQTHSLLSTTRRCNCPNLLTSCTWPSDDGKWASRRYLFFIYLCDNAKVPNTIGSPFWRYRLLGTLILSASFHLVARTQVRLVYCANPSIYLVLYIQSIPRFMHCMDWGINLSFRSSIIEVEPSDTKHMVTTGQLPVGMPTQIN